MTDRSERLARAVDDRRRQMGYTTWQALEDAAGISSQGLRNVRYGERRQYQDRLVVPLTRALGWTPDSIQRLLNDEDPVELDEPLVIQPDDDVLRRVERLGRDVAAVQQRLAAAEEQAAESDESMNDALRMLTEDLAAVARRVAALEDRTA